MSGVVAQTAVLYCRRRVICFNPWGNTSPVHGDMADILLDYLYSKEKAGGYGQPATVCFLDVLIYPAL
jgi:hypothetical protein